MLQAATNRATPRSQRQHCLVELPLWQSCQLLSDTYLRQHRLVELPLWQSCQLLSDTHLIIPLEFVKVSCGKHPCWAAFLRRACCSPHWPPRAATWSRARSPHDTLNCYRGAACSVQLGSIPEKGVVFAVLSPKGSYLITCQKPT